MKLARRAASAPALPTPQAPPTRAVAPTDSNITPGGTRLGELVVGAGLSSEKQVAEALEVLHSGVDKQLGRILVERDVLSERDLAMLLARQHGLEVVDLRQIAPTAEGLGLVTEEQARNLRFLPLSLTGDVATVAVADPAPQSLAAIRAVVGKTLNVAVAAESEIMQAINNSFRAIDDLSARISAFEERDSQRRDAALPSGFASLTVNDDAPVVQVVQRIITQGIRDRASDIHIESHGDTIRIRFRIDGALHDVLELPGSMGPAIASRIKIMAEMNIVERRRPQDGQISMDVEGRGVDIRVATTPTIDGEKVVMRLLDKSRPLYQLAQLGMPEHTVRQLTALLHSPYGMIICAGPTGSGKTTTLYGALGEINDPSRNVMTIEDPVEYTFGTVNQIQINEQAGVTFAAGLKSILRQDPDVILVGEIRDVETARIAVQSALTGHLVLSSLHATDSISALHRLLDMGIEPFLVASSVTAVVAQRLMRRVCKHCRVSYSPPREELEFLREIGLMKPKKGFFRGPGCNFCAQTGYLERIGVYEVLPVSEPIRALMLDRGSHEELRALARAEGMRTLLEGAGDLITSGITNIPEVLRAIYVQGS